MQDPKNELPHVIGSMRGKLDSHKQVQTLCTQYYAPDAEIVHTAFVAKGRDLIANIVYGWQRSNIHFKPHVRNVYMSQDNQHAIVDIEQEMRHWLLPLFMMRYRVLSEIRMQNQGDGTNKVIIRQEDHLADP